MLVIPVIDVRNRIAVKAVAGRREGYQALRSPLAVSADPVDVARGLTTLHPFPVIYVADLDGIEGRGGDPDLPHRISATAGAAVWIDSGAADPASVARAIGRSGVHAVLGSESGWTPGDLRALPPETRERIVLSLDYRGDALVGDAGLLEAVETWPQRVIVMTLARVGLGGGPDLDRLAQVAALARSSGRDLDIYAAGGVRDRSDLTLLSAAGIAGALVASALHAGTIAASDLSRDRWPSS